MAGRAAIVTGASSGIGLAIAEVLGDEGYGLTVAARRPEKLEAAAEGLRAKGYEVEAVAGSLEDEAVVREVVAAHTARFGRLDVLINNAGIGVAMKVGEIETEALDEHFAVNVRSMVLFYRETVDLLRAAAAEHRNALVVNNASITGLKGCPGSSIYAATKAAMVNFTRSMHRELAPDGIKNTVLCAALVDTPLVADFADGADMISTRDVAETVRTLLSLSPACVLPEIQFLRMGDVALGKLL